MNQRQDDVYHVGGKKREKYKERRLTMDRKMNGGHNILNVFLGNKERRNVQSHPLF